MKTMSPAPAYRFLIFALVSLTGTMAAMAQGDRVSVTVTGCPAGVYGQVSTPLFRSSSYTVERHEPNGPRQLVEYFLPCTGSGMLLKRMRSFVKYLPGYSLPTQAMADTLWARFGGNDKKFPATLNLPLARLAFGLDFLDTGGIAGRVYQYRVKFTDTLPATESREIIYRSEPARFAPVTYSQSHTDLHNISLEWRTGIAGSAPMFDVLRRQAGVPGGFQPLAAFRGERVNARGDSLVLMVFDSTAIPGISYDYCLLTRDFIGNAGNRSDTVRIQAGGRDNVAAIRNLHTRSADGLGIQVAWTRVANDNALRNIMVLRSAVYDSGYKTVALVPVSDTAYMDNSAVVGHRYFYQLLLQGAENFSRATPRVSGTYTGRVQLRAPEALAAFGLKNGVRLSWTDNEKNLRGFRIYRAAYAGGSMKLLGERLITRLDSSLFTFIDSTGISDKSSFYYAVAAMSPGSVTGPLSGVVAAAPAINSRIPVPTRLRSIFLNDTVVSITWHDLAPETPGFAGYRVFQMKSETDTAGRELPFQIRMNEFMDTLHEPAEGWYRFVAVNVAGIAGNKSSVIHVQAHIDKPLPPGRVRAFKNGRKVILDWDGSTHIGIRYYHVYRAENSGRISLLDSVSASHTAFTYTDAAVKSGSTYFYFITSVGAGSVESLRSPEVHLQID